MSRDICQTKSENFQTAQVQERESLFSKVLIELNDKYTREKLENYFDIVPIPENKKEEHNFTNKDPVSKMRVEEEKSRTSSFNAQKRIDLSSKVGTVRNTFKDKLKNSLKSVILEF